MMKVMTVLLKRMMWSISKHKVNHEQSNHNDYSVITRWRLWQCYYRGWCSPYHNI